MVAESRSTVVGRAEDGSTATVTLVSAAAVSPVSADTDSVRHAWDVLFDRWPPRGLVVELPTDDATARRSVSALSIEVAIDGDGTAAVLVNGVRSEGGWDRVESMLGLFAAEHLAERVAVHAAVVLCDSGAIVVAGTSHSGKSTLAVAARRRGWLVLGDEYALVDVAAGTVQGWPRPLRQRTGSGTVRIPLGDDERAAAAVDHEVAMVAALQHAPSGAGTFDMVRRADVVVRVLENTVCGAIRPEASFRAALAMTHGALTVAGVRGEADATLDRLSLLLQHR